MIDGEQGGSHLSILPYSFLEHTQWLMISNRRGQQAGRERKDSCELHPLMGILLGLAALQVLTCWKKLCASSSLMIRVPALTFLEGLLGSVAFWLSKWAENLCTSSWSKTVTLAVHLGLPTKCKVLLPHALRVVTAEPCLYLVSLIPLGCPHSAT